MQNKRVTLYSLTGVDYVIDEEELNVLHGGLRALVNFLLNILCVNLFKPGVL